MTDEEARNSQYWEERSEELSNEELKGVSGGLDVYTENFTGTTGDISDVRSPQGSGSSVKKGLEDLDGQVMKDSGCKIQAGSIF